MGSKIYTKSGDGGQSGLVSGTRVSKANQRLDLYGDVDELNSVLGFSISSLDSAKFSDQIEILKSIQNKLFIIGSNIACESELRSKYNLGFITADDVKVLENQIDMMDKDLKPLKNFILPGGSMPAATIHIARTNCRRLERKFVKYDQESEEEVPEFYQIYLNRLSDYLFVLARFANKKLGAEEVIWKNA